MRDNQQRQQTESEVDPLITWWLHRNCQLDGALAAVPLRQYRSKGGRRTGQPPWVPKQRVPAGAAQLGRSAGWSHEWLVLEGAWRWGGGQLPLLRVLLGKDGRGVPLVLRTGQGQAATVGAKLPCYSTALRILSTARIKGVGNTLSLTEMMGFDGHPD